MNDAVLALHQGGTAATPHLDGTALGLVWLLPFVGMLLSLALLPLLAPRLWERHFAKIATLWALAFLVPCAFVFGPRVAGTEALRTLTIEYLPFIILIFTLFVVAGGICVIGNVVGTPATNTALLAFGTLAASLIGSVGAAMVLIRPVIRANQDRRHKTHVFIFFVFLVCNIGGCLTPLGNPPLFLGYLKGVDFLWTVETMFRPMLIASGLLLALFYLIDRVRWFVEFPEVRAKSRVPRQLRIEGLQNVVYLAAVVAAVLASGVLDGGGTVTLVEGIDMPVSGLARDAVLLVLSYLSWKTTRSSIRIENAFAWTPIQEVAILFAAIFITMIPMLAMLRADHQGPFAPLLDLISDRRRSQRRSLFLARRRHVELSRQRPHLSRLLQPRRRRSATADGPPREHAHRHLGGGGVHGRQHLYRQRAELHGQVDRRGARHQDADLLRLYALVGRHPLAAVRAAHAAVLCLRRRAQAERGGGPHPLLPKADAARRASAHYI